MGLFKRNKKLKVGNWVEKNAKGDIGEIISIEKGVATIQTTKDKIYKAWIDELTKGKKEIIEEEENIIKKTDDNLFKKKKKKLFLIPTDQEIDLNKEELKEKTPLLLYINKDLTADVYENVQPGYIKPNKKAEANNEIHSRKRIDLHYKGTNIPLYILYEEERFCYPHEPKLDSKSITRSLRNIKQNYKDYEENTKGLKGIKFEDIKKIGLAIAVVIGVIMGALYIGNILGIWDLIGIFGGGETITTIIQNVSNTTASVSTGGPYIVP